MAGRLLVLVLNQTFLLLLLMQYVMADSQTTPSPNQDLGLVHHEALELVNSELVQMRSEIFQMNGELKATMNQVQAVTDENQLLKSKVTELEKELSVSKSNVNISMQTVIDQKQFLKRKVMELEKELNDSNSLVKQLKQYVDGIGSVAFMLQFKSNWVTSVTDNAILNYDNEVLNVGGGKYDPHTGIYTCPKAGFYLISVRCNADWQASGHSATTGSVFSNHTFLMACNADDAEYGEGDFVQMFLHLDKGDQLYVKQTYVNANEFAGETWTFFSGVLLVPK